MEGLQDWPSIFSAALDCDHLFDKCITQIQEPRINSLLGESTVAIGRLTRDHQARFQAWSSYLGVFAEHNVCLDHRLSNSKDVQVMVLDLIRIIAVNLQHFSSLIQISEDVLDNANNLATDLGQAQESIEGAIDRLHRLGVTIRQSSTASLISRVKAFSAKRSDPSLEEISFLMMKYLYPTAPLSLQRLLGRSILERFFNLKYREEHQRRLATRRSIVLDGEEHQPQVHNKSHNGGLELPGLTFGKDYVNEFADRVADSDAMLSQSGTKPSTLQADEFKRKTEAGNQYAALSVISRTSSVPIGDISYPKPPKPIGNGEFSWAMCSWCSESHPYGYFQDERWWRRHVDHDFRPYVCLFDTCPASLNGFAKFSPWLQHMEERHSTNWVATIDSKTLWRCDIEHNSPELFVNEASLRDHMREYHLESFTESQLVGIARRSSIRIPGSKDVCPLCGFDASKSPRGADQSNVSQQSWLNKRKRGSKHGPRANVNFSVQAKRRKVHFHDQAESSGHEPCSSSESDLDLTGGPGTGPISPHIDARLKRKQLSRHMATHLKALAFMSLRLKAFQEQSEERDQGSTLGDEQEETNEGGEPSGFDTELEALSLSFSDNPSFSSLYPTDDLTTVDDRDDTDDIDDLIKDLHASSPPRRPDTLFHNSSIAYRELDLDGLDGLDDEPDVPDVPKRSGNEYFGLPHLWSVTREDILEHQKSATPGPASQPSSTYAVVDGLQTHSGFGTETVPSSFLHESANTRSTQDSRDGSPNLEPPWLKPGYS